MTNSTNNHFIDKVFGLKSVPWKNKDEWIDVYEKVYSKNVKNQIEAYNMMLKWQERKRGCPLGVVCTCAMLQGVLKDKVFHPDIEFNLADEDLQFVYGGSVMRFLNLLDSGDGNRDNRKVRESLYAKALKIGLPDWIVNVRHEVSHRTVLPEINLLRLCVVYILNFLKSSYWEVEEKKLQDVILIRPREETLKECFLKLIHLYVMVKETQRDGIDSCDAIKDSVIREEICKINEYRLISEQLSNAPWEVNHIESQQMKPLSKTNLSKYSLTKLDLVIIKYIREYNKTQHINMWNIIINYVLDDAVKHQSVRLDIWKNFLQLLTYGSNIDKILDPLMDMVFKQVENYNMSFWAKKWLIIILQALLLRSKADKLKSALLTSSRGRWERKVLCTLTSLQKNELKQLIIQAENVKNSKKKNIQVYSALYSTLEKYDKQLGSRLKLVCDLPAELTIQQYIYRSCSELNDFSLTAFDFFLDMLQNPSPKIKKALKTLVNIYQGNETQIIKGQTDTIYTLPMVLDKLDLDETDKEYLGEQEDLSAIQQKPEELVENDGNVMISTKTHVIDAIFEENCSTYKSSWPPFLKLPWNS